MSNCIHIVKGEEAVFRPDEIDIAGFQKLVAEAKQFDWSSERSPNEQEADRDAAWWFLAQNSVADERGVVIRFGEGRSIHTNRDFSGTLRTLSRLVKKSKPHIFVVTDEFDGHKQRFKVVVDFKEGKY